MGPSWGWNPAAGGRGGGGWKMTPGLRSGQNGPAEIGAFFGVGPAPPKGAKLGKPSSTPLTLLEQRNGWRASVGALFRRSAVSGEWHPLPLLQPRNYATGGEAVPGGRAVARLHGCRGYVGIDPLGQGHLFDGDGAGKHAARYRGGATPKRQALPLAALRPAKLAEVVRFIQINQPRGHILVDDHNNTDDRVFG